MHLTLFWAPRYDDLGQGGGRAYTPALVLVCTKVPAPKIVIFGLKYELAYKMTTVIRDLEKVVDRPQAENSKFYNVLKIAGFATKDEENHGYQMLVWNDEILKRTSNELLSSSDLIRIKIQP